MLARLEALDGVARAETDYGGDYLRLRLRDNVAPEEVQRLLRELGYEADVVTGEAVSMGTVWYDTRSVGELSHIEAGVIADRVLPLFAREHHLSADQMGRVRAAVVGALHNCFLQHASADVGTGAFRKECVEATVEAVRAIVGPDQARQVGELLELDLAQDHRDRSERDIRP